MNVFGEISPLEYEVIKTFFTFPALLSFSIIQQRKKKNEEKMSVLHCGGFELSSSENSNSFFRHYNCQSFLYSLEARWELNPCIHTLLSFKTQFIEILAKKKCLCHFCHNSAKVLSSSCKKKIVIPKLRLEMQFWVRVGSRLVV